MKYSEHLGDLWSAAGIHWRVITINVYVKKNGELVMGRGIAREATQKFSGIAYALGEKIKEVSKFDAPENQIYINFPFKLVALPVKRFWNDEADLQLIEDNLKRLVRFKDLLMHANPKALIYLPKPGCGNGKRSWDKEVKPLADKYLDESFVVCENMPF